MSAYSAVLRSPGFLRVISSQLAARFPFGMMSLAFVMHIQHVHNSYTIAGLALGAETIGAAISGPLLSRWMGRFGVRRVILIATTLSTIAMVFIGVTEAPPLVMIALAAAVGLTSPPIQAAVRTIYPTILKKKNLTSAYSLDATVQEVIWIIGPVLATVLAAQVSTAFAVLVMAALQIAGGYWFASQPEVGKIVIPKSGRRLGGVLKNKIVLTNAIMGLLLIGSFSGVEVGAVGILDKSLAGVVIAAFSVGSLLGGILLGHRAKTKWALTKYLALICFGYSLMFISPSDPVWLSITFFIAGLGIAPALGVLGAIVGTALKTSEAAEAYGWIGTGQLMGYSAGAALAGIAIDNISGESALLIAIVFGLGCLAVSVMSIGITPALGQLSTETAAIKTIEED